MKALKKLVEDVTWEANTGQMLSRQVKAETANAAAAELKELLTVYEAAWKLAEHPTSEAKLQALLRLMGVEL